MLWRAVVMPRRGLYAERLVEALAVGSRSLPALLIKRAC